MIPSFFIAKSFVTEITFDVDKTVQLSPTPIMPDETSLQVEVGTGNSENNLYHLIEIQVNISSRADDNTPVYNLLLKYAAIVGTPDANTTDDELYEILKVRVPRILLDNIRSIVYQVTREAGFPFMMHDDTFDHSVQNADLETKEPKKDVVDFFVPFEQDTPELSVSERINFQWMISFQWAKKDEDLFEAIQQFWEVYSSHVGKDELTDFEHLPIYKGYYRFLTPIEYQHPIFEECDDSVWPMLFQMLYGSFQTDCQIIDGGDDLPEITFTGYGFQDRTLSGLSLEELKELLSELLSEALTEISTKLLAYRDANIFSEEQVQNIQLRSELDFYRLFDASVSDEEISLLNTMYEKIKECDLQTLLYQFLQTC